MPGYISSNNNRFYVAAESAYGVAPAIAGHHRIPAVKLKTKHERERVQRHDKTGSRTFIGTPPGVRHRTTFGLSTYMSAWTEQTRDPAHGPLFSAAMGAASLKFNGGNVSASSGTQLTFAAVHGLALGQAIAVNGELRFVNAIVNATSVQLNAPFTGTVTAGAVVLPTVTYSLAHSLPSASIFDYWSPDTATQRVLSGVGVDTMKIKVNSDFHEFEFSGVAADLLDDSSFTGGQAGLSAFPPEPVAANFDYTIIPGHLGQAWIGSAPNQFFTLTAAQIQLNNNIELRNREYGAQLPRCVVPGLRQVASDFTVFAQDSAETKALYQAARQKSPVSVMLQLGNQPQQMFGIAMRSVVPQAPEFDDSETRLQWAFKSAQAQGVSDDEITIAFA